MTMKKNYPLPMIHDLFDQLRGAVVFSKIDPSSIYHQVIIKDEHIHMISFRTRCGNYEFVVVPFGLTNTPTTFMCLMNSVLINYLEKNVLVFVEYSLVHSKTKEEHEEHLRIM
jgi:hypothetical protein